MVTYSGVDIGVRELLCARTWKIGVKSLNEKPCACWVN